MRSFSLGHQAGVPVIDFHSTDGEAIVHDDRRYENEVTELLRPHSPAYRSKATSIGIPGFNLPRESVTLSSIAKTVVRRSSCVWTLRGVNSA